MIQKRIGIDCRLSGSEHAGIGRYITSLIRELVSKDHEWTYVLFFYSASQAKEVLQTEKLSGIEVVIAPIKHYTLKEQLMLPKYFHRAKLDILHVPHFNAPLLFRGKLIITIHDLLWHEQKGTAVTTLSPAWYWLKYLFYRIITLLTISKAKSVIVPSQSVKNTVVKYYPQTESKISIIKEGVDNHFFPLKISKRKKQLLYVGSLYPHKNVQIILEALRTLSDFSLVVVGARNVFVQDFLKKANRLKVSSRVKFKGKLSDQELNKTYNESWALVQPSLSEGFGLTGLEAMRAKTLVIASNIATFKEIYQSHAFYFDPKSPASLERVVTNTHQKDQQKFIENSYRFSKGYTFAKMTQDIIEIYKQFS